MRPQVAALRSKQERTVCLRAMAQAFAQRCHSETTQERPIRAGYICVTEKERRKPRSVRSERLRGATRATRSTENERRISRLTLCTRKTECDRIALFDVQRVAGRQTGMCSTNARARRRYSNCPALQ